MYLLFCFFSLTREDLNDEEMMEELDDELSEDEEERGLEEEVGNGGATALSSSSRLRQTPDSELTVDQKRACYLDPTWRLQVILLLTISNTLKPLYSEHPEMKTLTNVCFIIYIHP